ncbi:hypothetical protein [uncultured Croceitalea sp.]|uniref:hypothetical protein n=1 Tax=uncultured Croceitalea sp. TaxID=1798908 RepID=UPI0033066F3E
MSYSSKSQYHDAFASMVKITMRDGDASESEIIFLEHLMYKLSLEEREYEFIMENYMKYPITVPYSYDERISALYQLGKILNADIRITGDNQKKWLERIVKTIGFEPNASQDLTLKALVLTEEEIDFNEFSAQIRTILSNYNTNS